jgi:hypothetical protein
MYVALAYFQYYLGALVIFVPLQTYSLYARTLDAPSRPHIFQLARVSIVSVTAGCLVGGLIWYVVMFGPAILAGNSVALPWLTMFPALVAGYWAGSMVSRKVAAALINKLLTWRRG